MCKSTDEGGKRCAAHMSGSLAAVSMASIISGIKEEFVRKVFSALNKEGKHLPMPSEEEIIAFARNNQFISRHDVTIPDNKRAMLVRRWQKAEMERPSGGTFHAWKHTMVESIVRWRRTATVVGIGGVLAFTSACSGGTISDSDKSPVPSSSPTSISQTATPGASESGSSIDPSIAKQLGAASPAGEEVQAPYGNYRRSVLSPDDPALAFRPEIIDPSTATVSPQEAHEAQKSIVTFMAEDGIDSPLNGGGQSVDEWWSTNKDKFHPDYQGEIYQAMKEDKPVVMNESWQKQYGDKYRYQIDEKTKTRIYDRKITPTAIWELAPGTVAVQAEVSYTIPATPGVGQNKTGVQRSTGTMTYSATKDLASGKWLIDGYDHDMKTHEG